MKKAFVILSAAGMHVFARSETSGPLENLQGCQLAHAHGFRCDAQLRRGVFMRDKMEKIPEALERMEKSRKLTVSI